LGSEYTLFAKKKILINSIPALTDIQSNDKPEIDFISDQVDNFGQRRHHALDYHQSLSLGLVSGLLYLQ